jgi:hypothetical protein
MEKIRCIVITPFLILFVLLLLIIFYIITIAFGILTKGLFKLHLEINYQTCNPSIGYLDCFLYGMLFDSIIMIIIVILVMLVKKKVNYNKFSMY